MKFKRESTKQNSWTMILSTSNDLFLISYIRKVNAWLNGSFSRKKQLYIYIYNPNKTHPIVLNWYLIEYYWLNDNEIYVWRWIKCILVKAQVETSNTWALRERISKQRKYKITKDFWKLMVNSNHIKVQYYEMVTNLK